MTAAILSFAPTPAPQPAPAPAPAPQADQGFARLLSQRQALAHPAPTQPGATAAQPAEGEAPAPNTAPQRTPAQRPQAEREPAKAEKARPAEAKATPAEEAPSAEKAEAGQDQDPIDPAIADWLAALNLPAQALPTERPEARGKLGKPAQDEDLGAQLADKAQGGTADPRAAQSDDKATDALQAARDSRERASSTSATTAEASASQAEWQAALEHVQAPKEATDLHDAPGVNALASAAPTTQAQRSEATAAPVSVPVPTPVDAPDFAKSLGVQVSVLARDGVQQAELHLNPAEMGPISVQIAIEGTQAQVNFGADMAATRQVIESGLPELAAALRDAGFTLSGGGVHSQARGRDERGGSGPGREPGRGNAPGETEVTPRRTQARISAGGVDLYV